MVRELMEGLDRDQAGHEMFRFVEELFPICRSITGDGIRETLRRIGERIPLELHEVPTGTRLFDWTVPKEWNTRETYIESPGRRAGRPSPRQQRPRRELQRPVASRASNGVSKRFHNRAESALDSRRGPGGEHSLPSIRPAFAGESAPLPRPRPVRMAAIP